MRLHEVARLRTAVQGPEVDIGIMSNQYAQGTLIWVRGLRAQDRSQDVPRPQGSLDGNRLMVSTPPCEGKQDKHA